jgi:hypothetical protein
MMREIDAKLLEQWIHLLKEKAKKINYKEYLEILSNLECEVSLNFMNNSVLHCKIPAEIYTKYNDLEMYEDLIWHGTEKFRSIAYPTLTDVEIHPDYDKFTVYNSEIISVLTPWEEINRGQNELIEALKASNHSLDFMSVGNTARSLLSMLADEVFDPVKHTSLIEADGTTANVRGDKSKNKLRVYVRSVLNMMSGNEDLQRLALAAIEHIHCAADSGSTLAHKYGAESYFAEMTAIGTINTISIVKLVKDIENKMEKP